MKISKDNFTSSMLEVHRAAKKEITVIILWMLLVLFGLLYTLFQIVTDNHLFLLFQGVVQIFTLFTLAAVIDLILRTRDTKLKIIQQTQQIYEDHF